MANLTDPANELAQLAKTLSVNDNKAGHAFLATKFNVDHSSTEFFAIIHLIMSRADKVANAVKRSEWEEEQQESALEDIEGFKSAFTYANLTKPWSAAGSGPGLMKDHGRVITYMSEMVRKQISYPTFTPQERVELIHLIDDYTAMLEDSDYVMPFVRQAILDGVAKFRFSLQYLEWGGAEYTLEQFRELAQAYQWMNDQPASDDFNSKAALDGLLSILQSTKEKVDTAKGWADAGSAVAKTYTVATNYIAPLLLAHHAAGG